MSCLSKCCPENFGMVCATGVGSVVVNQMLAIAVVRARKRYDVQYPTMYLPEKSPNAQVFNCIQRCHQNFLEMQPQFLLLLFLSGTRYPRAATGCGVMWLLSRLFYTWGYSTGNPSKRNFGVFGMAAYFGLLGMGAKTAWECCKNCGTLAPASVK